MRKTNLHSLLIIAASIILLSSCSQVRQITTSSNHKLHLIKADRNNATAKAESPKVIEKKELDPLPAKDDGISSLQEEKKSAPKLRPVKSPMLHPSISKESKTKSKSGLADKKFQQLQKVINRITVISDLSNSIKNEKKLLPYGNDASKYLKLWIIFLIAAVVLYIIAIVAIGSSTTTGGLGAGIIIYILAFACSVLSAVFFIIWLVKLFS